MPVEKRPERLDVPAESRGSHPRPATSHKGISFKLRPVMKDSAAESETTRTVSFRIPSAEFEELTLIAKQCGYPSVSALARDMMLSHDRRLARERVEQEMDAMVGALVELRRSIEQLKDRIARESNK